MKTSLLKNYKARVLSKICNYGIIVVKRRRFFKLCRDYFASLMVNCPGTELLETYPKSERDRKVRRVVLLSSIKLRVIPWEKSPCTELVGHKIARLNRKSFFYLNHHPLVHFLSDRSQQKVNFSATLISNVTIKNG